jgi:DNA-binding transcriptional LysR family regulator
MNIEFIKTFIKLTEVKSFSKLANDIEISQSTLSNRISQIEKYFNVKLIDRTTRTFNLTEEGAIFLDHAIKIMDLMDSCEEELSKYSKYHQEEIIITASTLPGAHILPKDIANFREKNEAVSFKILINNSQKSLDILLNKNADFAGIGSFMDHDQNNFDFIKIGEDKLVFICSNDSELIKNGYTQVNFSNLLQSPFISREKGSGTRNLIEQQFPFYKQLDQKLEMNDNDSIISAVSDSKYISIMSETIAVKARNAGLIEILEIKEHPIIAKRDIFLLKLKGIEHSMVKKQFWNHLVP